MLTAAFSRGWSITPDRLDAEPMLWGCVDLPADMACTPADLSTICWMPAEVPGTFADALRMAGRLRAGDIYCIDGRDVWYRVYFSCATTMQLILEGLAGYAEVWLNRKMVMTSSSMFHQHRLEILPNGSNELALRFRDPALLPGAKGRAKWHTRLSAKPWLRHVRTTLLGHMPEWSPEQAPVGPWRPILLRHAASLADCVSQATIKVDLQAGIGRVRVMMNHPAGDDVVWMSCDGQRAALSVRSDGTVEGEILIPTPRVWWPHTHGAPDRYDLTFHNGRACIEAGPVGFRRIAVDRGLDGEGFALLVNDLRIFCRGACWVPPDLVSLGGTESDYRMWLSQARDAGMNMIRVGGTMIYEADLFYRLCDELGLLVWQDFMFANHDYPRHEDFLASVHREVEDFLHRVQSSCCIAVLCGGSEIAQQAAMMGLDARHWHDTLADRDLATFVARLRPDVPYVPHSPGGGAVPFQVCNGIGHYYGVGAYLQPLEDARRAHVRFATECLALAHVPEDDSPSMPGWGRDWKKGVPRDPGSAWDFEDVRDHYLGLLSGLDPLALRGADATRYLALSRATSCVLIEAVFGEWRSAGSSCAGGLVWLMRDLSPGAGWGLIDHSGHPKPVWFALRRALATRTVVLTDETVNGLALHLINETASPLDATLVVYSLRDGEIPVARLEQKVTLEPRETRRVWLTALLGRFYDHTAVYKFGPPAHTVTCAHLIDADGGLIGEDYHFPHRVFTAPGDVGLRAVAGCDGNGWYLDLKTVRLAQFVHFRDPVFKAEEAWFHLSPLRPRRIRLERKGSGEGGPDGDVQAINHRRPVHYAATGREM